MESTGGYWKPVFNILEEDFEIILVNARHVKNVPGRWTVLGAQNILNLRSQEMSGRWPNIVKLIENNQLAIAA